MAKTKAKSEAEFLESSDEEQILPQVQGGGEQDVQHEAAAALPVTTAPESMRPKERAPVVRHNYVVKCFHKGVWRGPFPIEAVDESEAIQRVLDSNGTVKAMLNVGKFVAERA